MRYSVLVLLVILALSMFTSIQDITAYTTHSDIAIDGNITKTGCERVKGTMVTEAIDAQHTQTAEFCTDGNKYLMIAEAPGCEESTSGTYDPFHGGTVGLPTPCDKARPCDPSSNWGYVPRGEGYKATTQVKAEGKQFEITTLTNGVICDFEFIKEEKKISLQLNWLYIKSYIGVTIPRPLLDGEFKVMVDGNSTEFEIKKSETYSEIAIRLDLSEFKGSGVPVGKKVEIIGTQVIPEFPIFGLIIFTTAIALMMVTRLLPTLIKMRN